MTTSAASLGPLGTSGQQNPTGHDAFRDLDMQAFIKLLVAQLSNQDPLDPMDNSEILQQVSQMREIAASDKLTESLDAIKLGQNVAIAGSLIGQTIVALTDDGERVIGEVERVSIEFGVPKLHVGEHVIDIRNVAGIASSVGELELDQETEDSGEQADTTPVDGT